MILGYPPKVVRGMYFERVRWVQLNRLRTSLFSGPDKWIRLDTNGMSRRQTGLAAFDV